MKQNPTRCATIRADLKAFADGELSPLARLRVAHHLRVCPLCREELIQMQTLSTELQQSENEVAPLDAELRAHILESVPSQEPAEEEYLQQRRRRIARKKAILAVCSAAGALLIIVNSGIFGGGGGGGGVLPAPSNGENASKAMSPDAIRSTSETSFGAAHNSGIAVGGASNESFLSSDGHMKSSLAARRGAVDQASPSAASSARDTLNNISSTNLSANPVDETSVVPSTRTVHRQGSLSVYVPNAEDASDDATRIIKNAGGFVANGALETGANQRRTATLDCRVPVTQFEVVVSKIGALGKVRAKSLNGEDITTQVAQSGARRQTLSQELAIAQARLDQSEESKKKRGDTFQLRAEVRSIRIQAAQARAQLEALQKYGALSSLYVSLQDAAPTPTAKATSWTDSLSPTSRAAWNTFLSNARLPLQLLMWALAYAPLWLPLLLVWRKFGRKWLESA